MNDFDIAFDELMILEGRTFTDDPDDEGGATKYGISKLAFPDVDIEHLTLEDAKGLYRTYYWDALMLGWIENFQIQFQLFESAVHMDPPGCRPSRAVRIAQYALSILGHSVVVDGIIGPKTIKGLNTYSYPDALLTWMNGLQFVALLFGSGKEDELRELVTPERLAQLKKYGRGWARRIKL